MCFSCCWSSGGTCFSHSAWQYLTMFRQENELKLPAGIVQTMYNIRYIRLFHRVALTTAFVLRTIGVHLCRYTWLSASGNWHTAARLKVQGTCLMSSPAWPMPYAIDRGVGVEGPLPSSRWPCFLSADGDPGRPVFIILTPSPAACRSHGNKELLIPRKVSHGCARAEYQQGSGSPGC